MKRDSLPLQVVILEDDPMARLSLEKLLGRDVRTEVKAVFGRPERLLRWLMGRQRWELPHVFVIDAEYEGEPGPAELLPRLREAAPHSSIVILTLYGGEAVARLAARMQVAGLILKKEIGLAMATAVYLARTEGPVYSAGLVPELDKLAYAGNVSRWRDGGRKLPRWNMLRGLSPRQEEVAWYCLILSMSAELAGEEIQLESGSVDKYKGHVYDKVEDLAMLRLDLEPLAAVMHRLYRRRPAGSVDSRDERILTGDEWAFHYLTQLPNAEEVKAQAQK